MKNGRLERQESVKLTNRIVNEILKSDINIDIIPDDLERVIYTALVSTLIDDKKRSKFRDFICKLSCCSNNNGNSISTELEANLDVNADVKDNKVSVVP